jgi:transposase
MPRTSYRDPKPESFWRDLIDRWRASGKPVVAFCAAQHVSQATFYAWRKRLDSCAHRTVPPAPAFASVRIVPDPTADVLLPTGLVIRVPLGADPAAVARLVAALGGATC